MKRSHPLILALLVASTPAIAQDEEEALNPIAIEEIERSEPVRFADEIYPVLKKNCIACHNASKAKAKLNLESPEMILKGSGDGPVVQVGKPMDSLLLLAAAHMEDPVMPPEKNKANAKNLTPKELGLLKRWIAEGAKGEAQKDAAKEIVWQPLPGNVSPVYAVDISDDNRFAVCSRGNRVFVYDVATAQLYGELIDPSLADKGNPAHLDLVQSLAFSRQGMLATGGFKTVKLWERDRNTVIADLDPLGAAAAHAAVSDSGRWIAANIAGGGEIALWDTQKPAEKAKRFKDHPGKLAGVAFAGETLVSLGEDGTIRVRKEGAEKPLEAKIAEGARSLVILEAPHRMVVGFADGMIRILKVEEKEGALVAEVEREWKSGDQAVTRLALSSAGIVSSDGGNDVHIWNPADGKKVRSLSHGAPVAALAARGGVVATSGNKQVKLWNAADGKPAGTPKTSQAQESALAEATRLRDVSKSRLDTFKKTLEEALKKRDESQKKARESATAAATEAEAERKKRQAADAALATKAAAEAERDRKKVAKHPRLAAAEAALKTATTESDKLAKELADAERKLVSARRNHDLATRESVRAADAHAKADARVALAEKILAEAETRRTEAEKAVEPAKIGVSALVIAPDGKTVAGFAEDGTIRVWAVGKGTEMEKIAGDGTKIPLLAFQNAGALLSINEKGAAIIRNTRPEWKLVKTIGGLESDAFTDRVIAVAFSPDGSLLATGDGEPSRSGNIKLWRTRTGDPVWAKEEVHSDTVLDLAFSPDGQSIATGSSDRFAKIFSVTDGSLVHSLEGHTGHVTRVAWRADGLVLATGSADKLVKKWNTDTGAQQKTEPAFKKEVTGLEYAGTADRLVASSGEGIVRVEKDQLQGGGEFVHATAASADGSIVVAGGESGVFRGWTTADKKMVMEFKVAETEKPSS